MASRTEIFEAIWSLAAGQGLVSDYFKTELTELDVLDLVNVMLEARVISVADAVGLINAVSGCSRSADPLA